MAFRLAVASAAFSVAGGVLVGDGIWRHSWEAAVTGTGIMAAGAVGAVGAAMRYTLKAFDARTQAHADTQRRNDLAMQQREHDVGRREAAVDRQRTVAAIRIASYAASLDEARNANARLQSKVVELQQELDEVNDERNQLIVEELMLARQQFTSKGYGHLRVAGSDGTAAPTLGRSRARDVTQLMPEQERHLRRIDTP
ncbi:hypothetical protein [Streptomyces cylindrosporus]|uniref:Uncharacterized protein n=1 Tax=Streptomyces cylindrosporus TaxID=2927583 RepID=A0ABS9YJX7_9ACTN|nr:hypothetical protein [Streptomyces cylindrosporus]MCI3277557.1 hypothetical protein [Streptomyces cylindrosporus]